MRPIPVSVFYEANSGISLHEANSGNSLITFDFARGARFKVYFTRRSNHRSLGGSSFKTFKLVALAFLVIFLALWFRILNLKHVILSK